MQNKCYIISCELKPVRDVPTLHSAIRSYGTWARINNHTWAIVTAQSASEVRNNLRQFLNTADCLFVVKSGAEAAWANVACTNEWLKNNL